MILTNKMAPHDSCHEAPGVISGTLLPARDYEASLATVAPNCFGKARYMAIAMRSQTPIMPMSSCSRIWQ
jgi:hypothetical protein